MVRNYQRKTERAAISEEAVRLAIQDVRNGNMSIRDAASSHGLKKSMLHKRLMNHPKEDIDVDIPLILASSKYSARQVFSAEEESLLQEYLIKCSKMNYGLTYKQVRDFAFSYALKLHKNLPKGWNEKNTAGIDWMKGFMKRHPLLSLRKPENTSLARNINFNKQNVETFYKNLKSVLDKHKIPESRIINVDESGITTVLQSPKVVAPTGAKQVGQCVSAERGELVTFCGIITASGNIIPPVYVYPRVNFKDRFMYGAPSGSRGFASRSGWMTQEVFLEVIKHIQVHTCSTKENPILIVLDNHESHVCLETIIFCRENGIVLLTFPPHTSHRFQPLDVAVYGPFKNHCKFSFNKWISENPGKSITIYDIAKLTAPAFDEAFSRKNIVAAFKKTGISPFDESTFKDIDFCGSIPTDQPLSEIPANENHPEEICTNTIPSSPTSIEESEDVGLCLKSANEVVQITPSCSYTPKVCAKKVGLKFPTPEQIRPYPKAEPRKNTSKGRKKGRCCILTDTPEKNRIETELLERKAKQEKTLVCKSNVKRKLIKSENEITNLKKITKKPKLVESSDTESYLSEDLYEEEGMSPFEFESDSDIENEILEVDGQNINELDFLLIKLASKKTTKHFVSQVTEKVSKTEFKVKFYKKRMESFTFVEPNIPDVSEITTDDVICKLPQPSIVGGTSRAINVFSFKFKFTKYNLG